MIKQLNSLIKAKSITLKKEVLLKIIFWFIGVSITIINSVYFIGQLKERKTNEIYELKQLTIQNNNEIKEFKNEFIIFKDNVNTSFNKIYNDGYIKFNDFQEYSKKQFEIIIDHGSNNKTLIKDILELNRLELNQNMKNYVEKSKVDLDNSINTNMRTNIISENKLMKIINNHNDTTFYLNDVDKISLMKIKENYEVKEILEKENGLFNIIYKNK